MSFTIIPTKICTPSRTQTAVAADSSIIFLALPLPLQLRNCNKHIAYRRLRRHSVFSLGTCVLHDHHGANKDLDHQLVNKPHKVAAYHINGDTDHQSSISYFLGRTPWSLLRRLHIHCADKYGLAGSFHGDSAKQALAFLRAVWLRGLSTS